jgi:acetate kinase
MNVLVLNCGSSSVKFQLIATDIEHIAQNSDVRLAHGVIERIAALPLSRSTAREVSPSDPLRLSEILAQPLI